MNEHGGKQKTKAKMKNQKNMVGLAHALLTIATCRRAALEAEKTAAFDDCESFEKLRESRFARIEYRAGGLEVWAGKQRLVDGRHETIRSREVWTRPTFALRIVSTHRNGEILTVSDRVSDVIGYAEQWNVSLVNAEEFNATWNAEE